MWTLFLADHFGTRALLEASRHPLSENPPGLFERFPLLEEIVVSPRAVEIHVVREAHKGRELPGGRTRVGDVRVVFPDEHVAPILSVLSRADLLENGPVAVD